MGDVTQSESKVDGNAAAAPIPGALVVFSAATPLYRPVLLEPGKALCLGRDDGIGNAPVTDEKLSGRHAELLFEKGHFVVRDLGSRNGTFVDGQRVSNAKERGEVKVRAGAVVRLAKTLLVLHDDLRRYLAGYVKHDERVIGPLLQDALDRAVVARSRSGAHLLILGENGAGKELVATRYWEAGSPRGPWVPVNCATIPAPLAEQLLFGAVKGAYTNAVRDVDGFVAQADGGVLFLDEIAELDAAVQAKLLRFVETGEYYPLGVPEPRRASVRIVAASHRDLRRAVAEGRFREDLFQRLAQAEISLAPLRVRREEIPWLMLHSLSGRRPLQLHASAVESALLRPWTGNVRELLAATRKAADEAELDQTAALRAEHLERVLGAVSFSPSGTVQPAPEVAAVAPAPQRKRPSKEELVQVLAAHGGNKSAAARAMGVARTQFKRWLEYAGLEQGEDDVEA